MYVQLIDTVLSLNVKGNYKESCLLNRPVLFQIRCLDCSV